MEFVSPYCVLSFFRGGWGGGPKKSEFNTMGRVKILKKFFYVYWKIPPLNNASYFSTTIEQPGNRSK